MQPRPGITGRAMTSGADVVREVRDDDDRGDE